MRPSKPVCNHLHFAGATTYILGLQLSTFIFCNKQTFSRGNETAEKICAEYGLEDLYGKVGNRGK